MVGKKILIILFSFLSVQVIEQVYGNAKDTDEVLWYREKILTKSIVWNYTFH